MDNRTADGFTEVADALWQERERLEALLYALVQERLVLQADLGRWLERANSAVRSALLDVRKLEMTRAARVAALCAELRLDDHASLARITAVAPPPWDEILGEHRHGLITLAGEIDRTAADIRHLLAAGASTSGPDVTGRE